MTEEPKWARDLRDERDNLKRMIENALNNERAAWQAENQMRVALGEAISRAEHYADLWNKSCEQVATACEILGVDPTKVPVDGWTLLESARSRMRQNEALERTVQVLKARRPAPEQRYGGHASAGSRTPLGDSSSVIADAHLSLQLRASRLKDALMFALADLPHAEGCASQDCTTFSAPCACWRAEAEAAVDEAKDEDLMTELRDLRDKVEGVGPF